MLFLLFPVHSNDFGLPWRQAWTENKCSIWNQIISHKTINLRPHRIGALIRALFCTCSIASFLRKSFTYIKITQPVKLYSSSVPKCLANLNSFTSVRTGKASNSKIKFLQQYEKVTECQKFIKQGKFCYYSTTFCLKSSDVAFALEFHYY